MVIRCLYTAYSLLAFLEQDTVLTPHVRPLLTVNGSLPSRRTWKRLLNVIPDTLPALVGCLERLLVAVICPWLTEGRDAETEFFGHLPMVLRHSLLLECYVNY